MAEHLFLIDVGDTLDWDHYGIFFLRNIHERRVSVYQPQSIEDFMRNIPGIVNKRLNREAFQFDDYRIVFCFTRRYPENSTGYLCDFQIKSWIHQTLRELSEKTEIIIFDIYNGAESQENELKTKYREMNEELNRRGFISNVEYDSDMPPGFYPYKSDLSYAGVERLKKEAKAPAQGIRHLLETAAETTDNIEQRYLDAFNESQEAYSRIKMVKLDINPKSLEEMIPERLCVCRFILRNRAAGPDDNDLKTQYEFYKNDFNPDDEAARLHRYKGRAEAALSALINEPEPKDVTFEFEIGDPLPDIVPGTEIGGDISLEGLMRRLSNIRNNTHWEKEYFSIVDELESYEAKLEDYGMQIEKAFHSADRMKTESRKDIPPEIVKQNAEQALVEATKAFYQSDKKDEDTYSTILDITNQFQSIHVTLQSLIDAKKNGTWQQFFPVLIAAILMVIIPYLMTQSYVLSGIIHGNMIPCVCVVIFASAFFISKLIVRTVQFVLFRTQMDKLKMHLKKYLDGLSKRQQRYLDTVNAMIKIFNAKSELKSLEEEMNHRENAHKQKSYHIDEGKRMKLLLDYFRDFMRTGVGGDGGAAGGNQEECRIQIDKSVAGNEVYWI